MLFKKKLEVKKDSTSGLTTVEKRLGGYFCSGDHFRLKSPSVNRYRDKSFRERFRFCPDPT